MGAGSRIARIGESSPDCIGARWIGGYETATGGAQFKGINRKIVDGEQLIWIRPCTVVIADSGRTFGFVVGDRYDGTPASHRLYQFRTAATRPVTHRRHFRHLRDGQSGLRHQADADPQYATEIIATRIGELEHGVRTSLERMRIALHKAVDRSARGPQRNPRARHHPAARPHAHMAQDPTSCRRSQPCICEPVQRSSGGRS